MIKLTKREIEVAALVMLGLTNSEIAKRLSISPRTAQDHVYNCMTKYCVGSRRKLTYVLMKLA